MQTKSTLRSTRSPKTKARRATAKPSPYVRSTTRGSAKVPKKKASTRARRRS